MKMRLDQAFADLLQESHLQLVGRPLMEGTSRDASVLYSDMTEPLLAHDTSDDPRIVYANRAAQACFEYAGDEIVGLPSRLTAEDEGRTDRQRLLEAVARLGFIEDYKGVRITKTGRRFLIEAAVVWELVDRTGRRHGQAARFRVGRP